MNKLNVVLNLQLQLARSSELLRGSRFHRGRIGKHEAHSQARLASCCFDECQYHGRFSHEPGAGSHECDGVPFCSQVIMQVVKSITAVQVYLYGPSLWTGLRTNLGNQNIGHILNGAPLRRKVRKVAWKTLDSGVVKANRENVVALLTNCTIEGRLDFVARPDTVSVVLRE